MCAAHDTTLPTWAGFLQQPGSAVRPWRTGRGSQPLWLMIAFIACCLLIPLSLSASYNMLSRVYAADEARQLSISLAHTIVRHALTELGRQDEPEEVSPRRTLVAEGWAVLGQGSAHGIQPLAEGLSVDRCRKAQAASASYQPQPYVGRQAALCSAGDPMWVGG